MSPPETCEHAVGFALRACPFLKAVASKEGESFAATFALDPASPASLSSPQSSRRLLEEPSAFENFAASYEFFHGDKGLVPLRREGAKEVKSSSNSRCPFRSAVVAAAEASVAAVASPPSSAPVLCSPSAPFASISLPLFGGGMPDGGEWIRRLKRQQRLRREQQKRQRKPPGSSSSPPSSSSSTAPPAAPGGGGAGRAGGGHRGPAPPGVASRGSAPSTSVRPPLPPRGTPPPRRRTSGVGDAGGPSGGDPRCPLRDWPVLGALLPLAAGGETLGLNCPAAIVALRAAVARVPQVRRLRPRPLWLKGAAVVAAGAAANAPFGAWREHTKKFSIEWFVAVHATVPFVAALRQATALPRWALVLTVAGAVAGQMVGARVERARLEGSRKQRDESRGRSDVGGDGGSLAPPPSSLALLPPLLRSGGRRSPDRPTSRQQGPGSIVVV